MEMVWKRQLARVTGVFMLGMRRGAGRGVSDVEGGGIDVDGMGGVAGLDSGVGVRGSETGSSDAARDCSAEAEGGGGTIVATT